MASVEELATALGSVLAKGTSAGAAVVTFDPSVGNVTDFIAMFEAVTGNKTEIARLTSLATALKGRASAWLAHLVAAAAGSVPKVKDILVALEREFGDNTQSIMAQVCGKKQTDSEAAIKYFDEMVALFNRCVPALQEVQQIALVQNGLRSPLRALVTARAPTTMAEVRKAINDLSPCQEEKPDASAVTALLSAWTSQQNSQQSSRQIEKPREEIPAYATQILHRLNRLENVCQQSGYGGRGRPGYYNAFQGHGPQRQTEQLCYNCNRAGHFARDCWARRGANRGNNRGYQANRGNRGNQGFRGGGRS
jgi:hypothetical protein